MTYMNVVARRPAADTVSLLMDSQTSDVRPPVASNWISLGKDVRWQLHCCVGAADDSGEQWHAQAHGVGASVSDGAADSAWQAQVQVQTTGAAVGLCGLGAASAVRLVTEHKSTATSNMTAIPRCPARIRITIPYASTFLVSRVRIE
jgi:hypothetical protein